VGAGDGPSADDGSDELLRLAPELNLRLRGGGDVEILVGGRRLTAGTRVLGVLEQFAQPTTMRGAVERIRAHGLEAFIEATSLAKRLHEEGVLVGSRDARVRGGRGFDAPEVHVRMLDDATRTAAFLRVIGEIVRPGDVVLDLGTGTGVLAVAAAKAGAKRVYAIEERGIADAAERVFEANGVADRVQLVRGRSTDVTLPERADVLIGEVLGHDPLAEDIVATFRDARRRLLTPGARMVPRVVNVCALPVDVPEEYVSRQTFTEANVARWKGAYGVELAPLLVYASLVSQVSFVRVGEARQWPVVGEPVILARIDLTETDEVPGPTEMRFVARATTRTLGLILYFEAELSPSELLTTSPVTAASNIHWKCCLYSSLQCRRVSVGETVHVGFSAMRGISDLSAR
jgi:hypothetical protein